MPADGITTARAGRDETCAQRAWTATVHGDRRARSNAAAYRIRTDAARASSHASHGIGEVRYLVRGAGWPLVLLHAFPLSADMWRAQLERGAEGWRCIAPDLRGFGGSAGDAAGSPPLTMDDYAGDVEGLLNALEIDRAVDRRPFDGRLRDVRAASAGRRNGSAGSCWPTRGRAPTRRRARAGPQSARSSWSSRDGASGRRGSDAAEAARRNDAAGTAGRGREARRLIDAEQRRGHRRRHPRTDAAGRTRRRTSRTFPRRAGHRRRRGRGDAAPRQRAAAAIDRAFTPGRACHGAGHLSNLEAPEDFSRALNDFLSSNL